ncbi:MAG: DDE-type integrase/transposase/recombinase [Dehalococcoidia bacterium]
MDEFCRVTGYHRKAAVRLLNRDERPGTQRRSGRPRRYGPEVAAALHRLWEVAGGLSGKLLVPFLPTLIHHLERHDELTLPPEVRADLLRLSPATADRLLAPYRQGRPPRQPWTHRAAAVALRAQVPLRTFGEWDGVEPGALQADLVAHCGASTEGFYLTTLVAVDVATGWTELEAVWGKGESRVGAGLHYARGRLPMPMRPLHTDNGGEFLNRAMLGWCQREGIAHSRGRPYRKNDQAWAEQRNWTAVRRTVGYDRYRSKAALAELTRLYLALSDYLNFFQPVRKVVAKERQGARLRRRFDEPRTPYARLLASGVLSDAAAAGLTGRFLRLNLVQLRTEVDDALGRLQHLADQAYAR